MTKAWCVPAELLLAGLLLAGLWLTAPLAADIQLNHHDGASLTIPAHARRVVTLAPNLTELVYASGGSRYLLATVEYSDYPEEAKALPRVGDAFRVDLEALVALKPDLVITWASGNPSALVQRLEQLGLPVWKTEIKHLRDISGLLQAMGRAMGTSEQADQAAAAFDMRLADVISRYTTTKTVKYFYQVAQKPLYTVNGSHMISQSLALCGGVNVFEKLDALAPSISFEAVLAEDPEAMFAPQSASMRGGLDQWRSWGSLKAVRQDHLYYLDADRISRAAPRFLDTLEQACHDLSEVIKKRSSDKKAEKQ